MNSRVFCLAWADFYSIDMLSSEVIQEPLPLKPRILVENSVVLVKCKNGFTKTIPWTENPGKLLKRPRSLLKFSVLIYNVQMDTAVLGDRLPEGTQKPLLGPGSPSLQCRHWESSKVLAGLAFCEILSQYPRSAFGGALRGSPEGVSSSLQPKPSASICSV